MGNGVALGGAIPVLGYCLPDLLTILGAWTRLSGVPGLGIGMGHERLHEEASGTDYNEKSGHDVAPVSLANRIHAAPHLVNHTKGSVAW